MAKKKDDYKRKYFARNDTVNSREPRKRFLIVCEGAKTEPNYFKSFPVPKDVIDVHGLGQNTLSLVEEAIRIRDKDGDYDEVWCVFDKDSFPIDNFNQALHLAKKNNIKVAYSNEAFEIWYILHFQYRDSAMSRQNYKKVLTNYCQKNNLMNISEDYEKNCDDMYEKLKKFQQTAIKNAKKLLRQYSPADPSKDNPSTTVHCLVEELNKHLRP